MRTIPMKAREIKIIEFFKKRKPGQITQQQASISAEMNTRQPRRLEKNTYVREPVDSLSV